MVNPSQVLNEADAIDLMDMSPAAVAPGMSVQAASQFDRRKGGILDDDPPPSPRLKRGVSFAVTTLGPTPAAYSGRARSTSILRRTGDELL